MFIKDSNERIQGRGGWSNYLFLLFNNKFILQTGKWRDPYHFSLTTTTTHSSKQSEPLLVIFGGGGGVTCAPSGLHTSIAKETFSFVIFQAYAPSPPLWIRAWIILKTHTWVNSYLAFFIPYFRQITILPLMSLVATNQQFGSSEDSDQPGCPPRLTIKSSLFARRKLQSFANQTCTLKAPKNGWMPSYCPT